MILIGFLPAGAALFAAAGEFVYGGPSPGFSGFYANALFLIAGFDMYRLPFLFISVTGFIALWHGWFFMSYSQPQELDSLITFSTASRVSPVRF